MGRKATARQWKSTGQSQLRILEGAAEVFGRKGFHGATIREISREAGLSLPSLYHHFGDKKELFTACLDHVHQSVRSALRSELVTKGSLVEELKSIFESIREFHAEHPTYIYLLYNLTYAAPEDIRRTYGERYKDDFRDLVKDAFRRHRPSGRVRAKMTLIIALLNNYLVDTTAPVENRKLHSSTLAALDYLLAG